MENCITESKADLLVTCPFDPCHRLLRKRLPGHITKCSRNKMVLQKPEHAHFRKCPFNAEHWVTEADFKHHIEKCNNRDCVDRFLVEETERQQGNCTVPPYVDHIQVENFDDSEDWEAEGVSVPSGNFLEKLPSNQQQQPIFKNVQTWQPAQRRKYYNNLREKALELGRSNADEDATSQALGSNPIDDFLEDPEITNGPPSPINHNINVNVQEEVKTYEKQLISIGAGRGQPPSGRVPRIAANIFENRQPTTSPPSLSHPSNSANNSLNQENRKHKISIGRGHASSSNPFDLGSLDQSLANFYKSYASVAQGKTKEQQGKKKDKK